MNDFITKKNKRLKFTSKYNVKLYKKCLSLKLILLEKDIKLPNIQLCKDKDAAVIMLKTFYNRRERIPLRLLRFFYLLNYNRLIFFGVKKLLAKKLFVYNGKHAKLINVNRGLLEVTLKCSYTFGDLIFTRARYKFKKKK